MRDAICWSHGRGGARRSLGAAALLVSCAACLCLLSAGCGRKAAAPPQAGAPTALSQSEVDRIIPPLPESERAMMQGGTKDFSIFADRLRAVYAALPAEARHQVQTKGEYAFHLTDLPKEQADVIRELIEKDPSIEATVGGWMGGRLDLSKVILLFQHQGDSVALRFRVGQNEANWAPFGKWTGK